VAVKRKARKRRIRGRLVRLLASLLLVSVAALTVWEFAIVRISELRDPRSVRVLTVPTPRGPRRLRLGPENPYWTPLSAVSPALILCVVRAEDAKFFRHDGFDWDQMQDSLETDLEQGKYERGGSTITMQLARNLFLWRGKSLVRKVLEVYLTWRLEHTLTKKRILELYLNAVEWGPGVYGIGEASRHYFGKPPSELTLGESALLAAILPNPVRWSPDRAPRVARRRQQKLLARLRRENALDSLERPHAPRN
jgi:monofunctional biosynthetic peptidoglycan transglycosylase